MPSELFWLFILIGLLLIVLGEIIIILPFLFDLQSMLKKIEEIPQILIYVYHSDGFVFITSPILIIISVILLLLALLKRLPLHV